MKIVTTILIIGCLLVVIVGCFIFAFERQQREQERAKQQRVAEQQRIAEQQQIKAERRRQELKKCEEVLNWFQKQEYCTVKPFKDNDGKIAGYNISWEIKYSEQAEVIWDGNTKTVVPGKSIYVNGSETWDSDFGTYKQLVELKERFEDQKPKSGPK